MTRISRKIIGWILGVFACIAVALGVIASHPQVKTASAADVSVTFSAAVLGDASDATYGTSIRFDTSGAQWKTYHNWVKASDWASIADYTTINGRTVTEINNTTTHTQKITLMMQPILNNGVVVSSFLRLYIPAEIIPLGEVKAMGILDGWSFNNGSNNYTASATTFLRNGDTMVEASAYSAATKLTASNITIGTASNIEIRNVNGKEVTYALDSYMVNIDIGQQIATEYDTMYPNYKTIRSSIYINGKSIEEWNAQKIAEDARFKDPALYTTFPQNSDLTVYPKHADVFIKPVCLWGTSTGFRLSILQELVADCETVTVTVGAGCTFAGKFMVAETKSKTVLTQKVVDITDKLTLLDNTNGGGETWKDDTNQYYIHTNNEKCWTKSPVGGCLNEFDPSNAGGGQIQMKYIYFNGTSVYDINKNDDGIYNSEHLNIINGSIYAPIFAGMSDELGSTLKLAVPKEFDGGKRESIVIKKGFNVAENGVSYYTTNDVVFTNNNGTWTKEVKAVEIETEVMGIVTKANRPDADGVNIKNENFVIFQLSNNDYAGLNTTAITDISSLYGYIDIGGTIVESYQGEKFFNVWGIGNSIAFRFSDVAALQNVKYITIKAGAKFPSYNTQYNGAPLTYYVTSEDITFVHDVPNDTWTVGIVDNTVTYTVDGTTYHTETVASGNTATAPMAPTKAEDANYTYTFDCWTLDGVEYDFSTAVTSNITLVAKFNATQKSNTVDITAGLSFGDQGNTQREGTDTYLIATSGLAWTNIGSGSINRDYEEQLKYIYFNGRSIADINAESDDAYGSKFETITGNADCAPIAVLYNKLNDTSSYLQIWVPTGYPTLGATAEQNHQSIEIKAGFSITQGATSWVVSEDVKWYNLNNSWVNAKDLIEADTVTIGNPRLEGDKNELYKVDITSNSWNITCNNFDFMEGSYASARDYFFINGRSINDINDNTDDSAYTYSTWPMTGTNGAQFVQPILIETHAQNGGDAHKITLWIHKNYVEYLGDDFTVTLGKGYNKFTNNGLSLAEDVSAVIKLHKVTVDGVAQYVLDGNCAAEPATPQKDMTSTATFEFDDWYIVGTEDVFSFDTPITEDIEIEARFFSNEIRLLETEVVGLYHDCKVKDDDNWLTIEFSEIDYAKASENYGLNKTFIYDELCRIGFLDKVVLKGAIMLNSGTVSEATLMDVYVSNGQQNAVINIWNQQKLAIRLPVGSGVEEIQILDGCFFPSYAYVSGATDGIDTRYVMHKGATYKYDEGMGAFVKQAALQLDIKMADGASVRLTSDLNTSGLRFETLVSTEAVETLYTALREGKYDSATFGTLIVPKSYLMGGSFTHEWLTANGKNFLDITSSASIDKNKTAEEGYASFAELIDGYYSYFGSIVELKTKNYGEYFAGVGYVKLEKGEDVIYIYAKYEAKNSRSASFVANAAINDRKADGTEEYKYITGNNNYSPYSDSERTFLENYLVWSEESAIKAQSLDELSEMGGSVTITPITQKLEGAYVHLLYTTNVNVWGVFTYTDGNKTASEDFYLQAGTSEHKQYLDIFRSNGVGVGMNTDNLSMTSIKFTNAELKQEKAGQVRVIALYSKNETIDTAEKEIYLTVAQNDGSSMTVGAHLGLGGALTYLAKSGIYEGVIGGSSNWKKGTVAISKDQSVFDSTNRYKSGSSSSSYSTEDGYYGHATSSLPADGAVNLINNFDAGRQIQQSWYAEVGNDDGTENNGYTRAYCYTGSAVGQYWPYNPVQAGDVVSNPGQIIDYEVNEAKGYIYVKARAMDWAKGYDESRPCANAVEGGVTTKSYVENYYRLNTDGTLVVNNGFIDWNGFTDMALCDWASTELPAVYPVHTLNYYVSNIDGDGTWTDAIEYKSNMQPWSGGTAYHQFANGNQGDTKVEDWFAWANGGDGNAFGMGVYIPNVNRYTSGRSNTSTAYYTDVNFQNSNALPVDKYTEWSWGSFSNVSMVSDFAQRGNILADKRMMSNMQKIEYTYQSAYVSNTSYTAPGVDFRMEAYVPIEYSYVICVNTVNNIRSTFKNIKDNGTVTNAGNGYEKVGLDAWARADKTWTW